MKPVNVYSDNRYLPEGVRVVTYAETQPEYQPLPCVRLPNGDIATKWQLTDAEREHIAEHGAFYLTVKTFNQPLQPLMPMADEPGIEGEGAGHELFFYSPLAEFGPVREDSGLPPGFRDCIYNDTQIMFSFWDRVKILFGWKVRLEERTYTERRPGKLKTESEIRVYRQRRLPKGWGVVEAEGPKEQAND